jgi:hypothetical protein
MTIPRISKSELEKLYSLVRSSESDLQSASVHLGLGVLIHMLGEDWIYNYVAQEAKFQNLLTLTDRVGEIESG